MFSRHHEMLVHSIAFVYNLARHQQEEKPKMSVTNWRCQHQASTEI